MKSGRVLIQAKLTPPQLPASLVERPRLRDAVQRTVDHPLQAIVASAGSGKTTLALQVLELAEGHRGWVTLEPADNDPIRFWTYFAAAVAEGDELSDIHSALAEGPMGIQQAIDEVVASIEARGELTILVLDDFQNVTNPIIHQQLGEVLRHPPAAMRLIITSRTEPPLPMARLRTHGQVTEIRRDSLAFNAEEARQLILNLTGLNSLEEAHAIQLATRTEGWAAGVHLAGLALRSAADPEILLGQLQGEAPHLSDYLTQEALLNETAEVRQFLLDTSVLSELDPLLCDALTGRVDSLQVLRSLAERNVFTVAADGLNRQFRYHQLFREYLHARLQASDPDRIRLMNRIAAEWYEQRRSPEKSVWHAVAAGDHAWAAEMINAVWLEYGNSGRLATVRGWVQLLGTDWVYPRSEMCLIMAWGCLNEGEYEEAESWAERATEASEPSSEWTDEDVTLQVAALRSYKAMHVGDPCGAVAFLDPVLNLFGDESRPSVAGAMSAAATAHVWCEESQVDIELLHRTISHGQRAGLAPSAVNGHAHLALIAADEGDTERALAHADSALSFIDTDDEARFHRPAVAHLARAIAYRQRSRLADAQFELNEADTISRVGRLPLCLARVELERTRIHHLLGERDHQLAALGRAKAVMSAAASPDALQHVIRAVENETRFAPVDDRHLPIGARELTERELTIIRLLPAGLTRRELGEQLHISENTVKTHLVSIRRKLGLQGREDINAKAEDLGLL